MLEKTLTLLLIYVAIWRMKMKQKDLIVASCAVTCETVLPSGECVTTRLDLKQEFILIRQTTQHFKNPNF